MLALVKSTVMSSKIFMLLEKQNTYVTKLLFKASPAPL